MQSLIYSSPAKKLKGEGSGQMSVSTSTPGTSVNYLVSDSWTLQDAQFYLHISYWEPDRGRDFCEWMLCFLFSSLTYLPLITLIPNYSIMHNVGHKGTVHSSVSHHLQPYKSRLLALYTVCITTNAIYDVSQRTYSCIFIHSVKRPSLCTTFWIGAMFFSVFQTICALCC